MSRSLSEIDLKHPEIKVQDLKHEEVKISKLVLLLGRELTVDEQKLLSLAGTMLFKFDSQIHGKLSMKELVDKFDGVVVNMLDENSITWYSEHKHQLKGCKVVYIAKQGSPIVDKIDNLKQSLAADVVLKYLPQTAVSKDDLVAKLHDHISRAGTKSAWNSFLKVAGGILSCLSA